MVLEDMEAGSIKVWFKNILNRIPDDAIRELEWKRAVGAAIVKAKYKVLQFLDSEDGITKPAIDYLRQELRNIARETNVRHFPD
jgi:hypothetical protein